MSIRWTHKARLDLDSVFQKIAEDRPSAAQKVIRSILSQVEQLDRFPRRGRNGRVPRTRELIVPRLPYIVVYLLEPSLTQRQSDIVVLRVIHGARLWPPGRHPSLGFPLK